PCSSNNKLQPPNPAIACTSENNGHWRMVVLSLRPLDIPCSLLAGRSSWSGGIESGDENRLGGIKRRFWRLGKAELAGFRIVYRRVLYEVERNFGVGRFKTDFRR